MTTFKEIRGTAVESVSSDPTNPEVGQIWYNNTIGVLKGYKSLGGAFSSGGNLNTARTGISGAGTQTAGFSSGGVTTSPSFVTVFYNATEEYDGSTWTSGNNMPTTISQQGAAGIQTAALTFGGYNSPLPGVQNLTFKYDGTNWTTGNTMGTGRYALAGCGTQTAGLAAGGTKVNPSPPPNYTGVNNVEEYDGTNWSSGNTYPSGITEVRGTGSQTSALMAGGFTTTIVATSNYYDGTNWTSAGSLNTVKYGGGMSGTQTAATYAGGYGGSPASYQNQMEIYNGTSWSTQSATLSTARNSVGSSQQGTTAATMIFGGSPPNNGLSITEEWNDPTFAVQKITTS